MVTNKPKKLAEAREVQALRSTTLSSDDNTSQVLLAPWGLVQSSNGNFLVDEEAVRLTQEAFEEHGIDLPIDYEHQTLGGRYASPSGQAPAAGWIKRIFGDENVGLLADIEWTDQAKQMLAAKQYRYLSPVAVIRKTDRKLVAMHAAALTNKPAIVGMQPIVNRLDAPALETDANPLLSLRAELNLPEDAGPDEVLQIASQRLVALQREAAQRRVDQRVGEAIRAGKLVEAQRSWAEALVAREEDLFDEWFRTAPVAIAPGATAPPLPGDSPGRKRQVAAARARSEFKASALLGGLTSEEAYVADALSHTER